MGNQGDDLLVRIFALAFTNYHFPSHLWIIWALSGVKVEKKKITGIRLLWSWGCRMKLWSSIYILLIYPLILVCGSKKYKYIGWELKMWISCWSYSVILIPIYMFIFFKIKVGRHVLLHVLKIDVLHLHHRKYIICNTHIRDSLAKVRFDVVTGFFCNQKGYRRVAL